jgi:hypothetical protein
MIKISTSQNIRVVGRIIDGKTLEPFSGIDIGFNSNCNTSSTKNGLFELKVAEKQIIDTLRISSFYFYQLKIINLPKDSIIDLGTIPMYEYYRSHSMETFDCRRFDIICKHSFKKFRKAENKRNSEYFESMNRVIEFYRLRFKNRFYKVDIEKHLIDLNKPTDE